MSFSFSFNQSFLKNRITSYDDFLCINGDGVTELLDVFADELETASPFSEEDNERVAEIRGNVSNILENVFG